MTIKCAYCRGIFEKKVRGSSFKKYCSRECADAGRPKSYGFASQYLLLRDISERQEQVRHLIMTKKWKRMLKEVKREPQGINHNHELLSGIKTVSGSLPKVS